MTNTVNGPYIVTGASGHLGRLVVNNLLAAGKGPIIAITRSPDKISDLTEKGIDVRQGDFNEPSKLAAAYAGGKRLLIISTDDLEPGKRLVSHANAIRAAVDSGIEHIVYTSLTNPVAESPITFSTDHRDTEAMLADSGISSSILRNNIYTDMLLMGGGQSIAMGKHFAASADGRTGYVTRADCASAAAAALMQETRSRVFNITGPGSITQTDVAAILSEIAGKDVSYIPISNNELRDAMIANGLPEFMATVFASFDEAFAQGFFDVTSGDLAELTGQPGQSVREFLTDNKAALLAPPQS